MARVMVVDDTDAHREALAGLLRRKGYEAVTAVGTDDALHQLGDGPRPDLILVDVKMPGLSGLDLLEMLQDDQRWRPVPVVMLTGHCDTHGVNRAAQLGARRCMVKAAFSVADMMDCVREYADRRSEADGTRRGTGTPDAVHELTPHLRAAAFANGPTAQLGPV